MISFNNLLMLAPMAGYTDLPFRALVKRFGLDISVSEMISSHALVFNSPKTLKMIQKSPIETPFSVQIAGSKKEIIKKAIDILNEKEGIDIIDLNCGCPSPKVSKHGNGSGLLKNLNLLVEIANLIKQTSNKPYTSLKLRLGYDKKIPLEIAAAINSTAIDFVVVHGRTKTDGYMAEKIDYESIGIIKSHIKIPLIANGEIKSALDAKVVREITGADGVMIGRSALKSPWIFYEIKYGEVPEFIYSQMILEHFENMIAFYKERGVVMFRKFLHNYSKGFTDASKFRTIINNLVDVDESRERIQEFFSKNHRVEDAFSEVNLRYRAMEKV